MQLLYSNAPNAITNTNTTYNLPPLPYYLRHTQNGWSGLADGQFLYMHILHINTKALNNDNIQ